VGFPVSGSFPFRLPFATCPPAGFPDFIVGEDYVRTTKELVVSHRVLDDKIPLAFREFS
jgi:hypothetical protein